MTFLPTCVVNILRGELLDGYGDPKDADIIVQADVPASIIEQSKRVFLAAENRFTTVRMFAARVRPGVDVREGDRLAAGASIYLVEGVSAPTSPVGVPGKRLDLRRIDQ